MNLTWHMTKKDLRRLWLPLLVLAGTVGGQVALGFHLLHAQPMDWGDFERVTMYVKMLAVLQGIVTYLWTGWLIHEDPVAGGRAFWITRPISGLRLLGAKCLTLFVGAGLMPLLLLLPWWLVGGYGAREIALAVAETLTVQGMVAGAALVVAVLTDTSSRFLGYTLVLMTVLIAGRGLALAAALNDGNPVGPPLAASRELMLIVAWLVIAAGIVVHQFVMRRTLRSWVWGCSGLALAPVVVSFWPWEIVSAFRLASAEPPEAASLALEFNRAELGRITANRNDDLTAPLELNLTVRGIPANMTLSPIGLTTRLRWPDGTTFERTTTQTNVITANFHQAAAGVLALPHHPQESIGTTVKLALPASLAAKWAEVPPQLELRGALPLRRARLIANMALAADQRGEDRAQVVRIVAVDFPETDEAEITLLETSPRLAAQGRLNLHSLFLPPRPERAAFLVVPTDPSSTHGFRSSQGNAWSTRIGTVHVQQRRLALSADRLRRDGTWEVNPEWPRWLETATFAKVAYEDFATVERDLSVRLDPADTEMPPAGEPAK